VEPNGSRGIDSVAARETPQDDLARAGHDSRAEQHHNVTPRGGLADSVQQIGAGTVPHHALHGFQQTG
jgi:hypothetical protein